jgi:uncharacterized protein (DUF2147 family)
MKKIGLCVAALAVTLFVFSGISHAAESTIVGVWSFIGDEGPEKGKERAQMEIYEKGGVYEGKYVKLPLAAPGAKCTACTGDKKDKPLMGMVFVYGMKKTGNNEYSGGKVYETEKGKEYKCKLSLENPNKLKLQGCIGFICKTKYWNRVK